MVSDIMKKVLEFTPANMILWREHSLDGIYLTFGKYKHNYADLNKVSLKNMVKDLSDENRYDVFINSGILKIEVLEELNEEMGLYERVPEDERTVYELDSREVTNVVLSLIQYIADGRSEVCIDDDGYIHLERRCISNELVFEAMWGLVDEEKDIGELSDDLGIGEYNLKKFRDIMSQYVDCLE